MKVVMWGSVIFIALAAAFVAGGWVGQNNTLIRSRLGLASRGIQERTGVQLPRPDVNYRWEVKDNGIVEAQGMIKTIKDDGSIIFDYGTSDVTLKQDENSQLFAAVHTGPTPQPAVPLSETGKELYEGAQVAVVYPEATRIIASLVLLDQ